MCLYTHTHAHINSLSHARTHTLSLKHAHKRSLSLLHTYTHDLSHTYTHTVPAPYGVATISRLLKTIGLFCKRAL